MSLSHERIRRYRVFLASPGDMNPEREAVRQFFVEYNASEIAGQRKVEFVVIDWENYSVAGVGRPQQLITQQTLSRYKSSLALVIGLMGERFGSPTGTNESGTEEEFEWALESHIQMGFPEIKWFFKDVLQMIVPPDSSKIREVADQWDKVQAFRKRVEQGDAEKGEPQLLYKAFTDLQNFRDVLRQDLNRWLDASERPWSSQSTVSDPTPAPSPTNQPTLSAESDSGNIQQAINTGGGALVQTGSESLVIITDSDFIQQAPIAQQISASFSVRGEVVSRPNYARLCIENLSNQSFEFRAFMRSVKVEDGRTQLENRIPYRIKWEGHTSEYEHVSPGLPMCLEVARYTGENSQMSVTSLLFCRAGQEDRKAVASPKWGSSVVCEIAIEAKNAKDGVKHFTCTLGVDKRGQITEFNARSSTHGTQLG